MVNLNIEGVEYTIIHRKPQFGSSIMGLMLGETLISQDIMSKSVTEFIRLIPTMLNNYATV